MLLSLLENYRCLASHFLCSIKAVLLLQESKGGRVQTVACPEYGHMVELQVCTYVGTEACNEGCNLISDHLERRTQPWVLMFIDMRNMNARIKRYMYNSTLQTSQLVKYRILLLIYANEASS